MNGKVLIAVGAAIVAMLITVVYLEQGEFKVNTSTNSTSNVPQSTNHMQTSITIISDKSSYSMGDAIVLSGTVTSPVPGTSITIIILDPNNLLLQAERVTVSPDGIFNDTLMTTPSIWKLSGQYVASAQYGTSNVKAQTSFNFTG